MTDSDERWAAVGAAIKARVEELNLTVAEVKRRGGPSDKTLTGYIAGQPVKRPDRKQGLCDALEWSSDSVDRILAGLEPISTREDPAPPWADLLAAMEQVRDEVRRLADRLDG